MARVVGVLLFGVVLAALACACGEMPTYQGQGGVFDSPVGIAIHWPYAYVTNANFDLSDDKKGKINVVDLRLALTRRDKAVIHSTKTDPYLAKIVLSLDGRTAYVAGRRNNNILYFDLTDPERPEPIDLDPDEDGTQGVGVSKQPFGLALSPDGRDLYVACISQGNITIVDLETNKIAQTVQLTSGVSEVKFDPTGTYAYVTNRIQQTVTLLEAGSGAIAGTFEPGPPTTLTGYDNRGLDFTPDGRYLFIAARSPGALLMIDTDKLPLYPQRALLRTLPTDLGPTGVAVTPDGREAWVCNFDGDTVAAFHAETGELLRVMRGIAGPYDIKIFEDGDHPGHYYALTANFQGHNLTLLDVLTKEVIWAIP